MDEFAMGAFTDNSASRRDQKSFDLTRLSRRIFRRERFCCGDGQLFRRVGFGYRRVYKTAGIFCGVVGLNPTYGSSFSFWAYSHGIFF